MNTVAPIAADSLNVPIYGDLLRVAAPKVIKTAEENRRAIRVAEQLMEKDSRTPEEDALLDLLGGLIDSYEREAYPKSQSTPRDRLQFLLEENDLKPVDIAHLMGSRASVSLVLSGKREISKEQARKLGERFRVNPVFFLY